MNGWLPLFYEAFPLQMYLVGFNSRTECGLNLEKFLYGKHSNYLTKHTTIAELLIGEKPSYHWDTGMD